MRQFIEKYRIFFQPVVVSFYFIVYMTLLDGDRNWMTFLPLIAFALGLDATLKRFSRGKWEFPLPGITTGIASIMILRATYFSWPYYFAIALGLGSKHVFRDERKQHIFNPAALGILAAVSLFPDIIHIHMRQWAIPLPLYVVMFFLGSFVTVVNRKWRLTLSYLLAIVVLRALWGVATGHSLAYAIGAIASLNTLIFAFHMITDPKTSPKSEHGQLVYGLMLALVDFGLRTGEFPFSAILSICLVNALVNPWRERWPLMRGA